MEVGPVQASGCCIPPYLRRGCPAGTWGMTIKFAARGQCRGYAPLPQLPEGKWQQQWRYQVTSWVHGPSSRLSGGPRMLPLQLHAPLFILAVLPAVLPDLLQLPSLQFCHLSHLSIARSFIKLVLQSAVCHTEYYIVQTALHVNTYCSESLIWFKVSGGPQTLKYC